jgi:5-methylcytosine-specific restriction enzyme subunit McrC
VTISTTAATGASVTLAEYERCSVDAAPPTPTDLRLAARLAGRNHDPRLEVRWLAGGRVEVAASSWVGVARFSSVEVTVVPKLVGGELGVLRMLEYVSGVNLLRRLPQDRSLHPDQTNLFGLIALLLGEEAQALTRDGLLRDYRAHDDTLNVLRGRLRHRDQFLRRFGRLDQLDCTFDEYDSDTPDNQFVAAALTVARQRVHDSDLRKMLGRLATLFAEACTPLTADPNWYQNRISYGRRNDRYRPAHELAALVLRGLAFDDLFETAVGNVGAFLLDMNVLFERFATRLVSEALAGSDFEVTAQRRLRAVVRDEIKERPYTDLIPDLVVTERTTGRAVPIDVKYKRYDLKKISTGDIFQTFLYAYALGRADHVAQAGILYPSTEPISGPRLSIIGGSGQTGARIVGGGLNVPQILDRLNEGLESQLHQEIRDSIFGLLGTMPAST